MTRRLRPHEQATLLAAGTLARRAATAPRLRALLDHVSWPALLDELARQRLVPLLGGRILEAAASAPDAFAAAVARETRGARTAGELGELVTLRVAGALESAGVANVPLKGPLQARALHGDAAMRSSRDIDVLVRRDDLARSADALAGLGWRVDPDAAPAVLHVRLVSDAGLPDVELHWRLHWYERDFAAGALGRAALGRDGLRRLQPTDELVALTLYHARDGLAGLRHATDVAAWWDMRHDDDDDGGGRPALGAAIAGHPALGPALTASALVLDPLVGTPAGALIGARAQAPWTVRRAAALANPLLRGSAAQIVAEASLVDVLLAPRGRRRASLRRRALPSPQELPSDSRHRSLVVRRTEHLARLIARCAFALVRRRPASSHPIG